MPPARRECGSGNELEFGSGNGEGGKSEDGGQKLEVGMRKWELMDLVLRVEYRLKDAGR